VSTLVKRTLSGLVFIAIMVPGMLFHPLAYAVLMLVCVSLMTLEFYRMSIDSWNKPGQVFGFLSAVFLYLTTYVIARHGLWEARYLLLIMPLPVTAAWITVLYNKSEDILKFAAFLFLPILYIAVPFSIFNFLSFPSIGTFEGSRLLSLFIILWASDIGGYLIGMGFGQRGGHKLFPRISPKKSWEGFAGSIVFAQVAAAVLNVWNPLSLPWAHYVVLALLISVFGVLGDLIESVMKRSFGVKDTGTIMPGHGGLLDRFDAALIALPIAVIYILFVNLVVS
jgi:phosphatidate cytidylyltransferase